jgi:hypothetical protein
MAVLAGNRVPLEANFEPSVGQIYSGAGPSPAAILQMIHTGHPDRKPAIVVAYDGIHWKGSNAKNYDVMAAHNLYPGAKLQIGLQLPVNNLVELQKVGDGTYDSKIQRAAQVYGALPHDIFLRIGYEFDGIWNNYHPGAYIAAFLRIVDVFRVEGVDNVAFVWNSYTPANNIEQRTLDGQAVTFDKFAWYPGDEYVDWFSFNVWGDDSAGDVDPSFDANWFIERASAHQKPVLITELSYRATVYSWDTWFRAFFASVKASSVKGFQYINWNWPVYPNPTWQRWANGKYTGNPEYIALYNYEMQNEVYLHRDSSYPSPVPLWVAATRNAFESVSGTPWTSSAGEIGSYSNYDEYAIVDPAVYGYAVESAEYQYGNGWQTYWANLAETNYLTIRLLVPAGSSAYMDLEAYAYTDSSAQSQIAYDLVIGSRLLAGLVPKTAVKYKYTASDSRYGRVVLKIIGSGPCHIRVRHIGIQLFTDQTLPAPTGLRGTPAGADGLPLSWSPIDMVEAYNIYRDGQLIGTSAAATFADREALIGNAYSYAVSAWQSTQGEGYLSRRRYLSNLVRE